VAGAALAAALANHALAVRAERRDPPQGKFITADGVRRHYIERGKGAVIVMLHGNGASEKKVEMLLFAHLKRILKLDRLRLRGLCSARDEFHLAATARTSANRPS
jgi:hypothetical protein